MTAKLKHPEFRRRHAALGGAMGLSVTAADRPLRGTQVLLQRIKNRDDSIEILRKRVAELEAEKKRRRFLVKIDGLGIYWKDLTFDEANHKANELIGVGLGQFVRIVEDP